MTTADQPRPRSTWLAHNHLRIASAYLVAMIPSYVWPDNPTLLAVRTVFLVATMAAMVGLVRHETILCPRCVAEFPTDGAEQAQRRMRWLRYMHRYKLKVLLLLVGPLALTYWWSWVNVVTWAVLLVDYYGTAVHRRLELWCPWCRRGRGDDYNVVIFPVPTGSGSRS